MADSDYSIRGAGLIAATARTVSTVSPTQTIILIDTYQSQDGVLPVIGGAAMIGNEIVKIVAATLLEITVERGCADTVPTSHPVGVKVWFIENRIGYSSVEYMATETVGVKLLMKTAGGAMQLKNAPPNALTFNSRFARPYPPGNLLVNGQPLGTLHHLDEDPEDGVETLELSWAHRDRIAQADQLIGHQVGSIGPEAGTQYRIRAYNAVNSLRRTLPLTAGTTASYTLAQGIVDLGVAPGDPSAALGYLLLESLRDGFESWQKYRINFTVSAAYDANGWGNSWGSTWGN